MAKKKTTTKAAAKGKTRSKKLSVKKRPIKDLSARQSKSVKGGITGNFTNAAKIGSAAIKFGALPTVGDKFIKAD